MVQIPEEPEHSPGFLRIVEDAKKRVREASIPEAEAALESGDARVIDVREEHEWDEAHVRGAEHLGKGVIERDIEKFAPDPAAALILYCGGGFRSALAADSLQKMGYTNVRSMAGGWRGWLAAGGPIEEKEP